MLEEIYNRLCEFLKNDPNISAIGIAKKNEYNPEDRFIIYLIKKSKQKYPEIFENIKVETHVSGKIQFCG